MGFNLMIDEKKSIIDIIYEREIEKEKKEQQQQANENISKILNPNNKYKRTQKEILKGVFKDE